jgi:hypothetical protein
MVGHSYGGHSTIFTAAMEPRIKAAWANGPVSDFVQHGMHWATPKGGRQQPVAARDAPLPPRPHPAADHVLRSHRRSSRPRALGGRPGRRERRPMEEENCAAVSEVYGALGAADRVKYVWYPGDHDFPPHVRSEAVAWFTRWLRLTLLGIGVVTKDEKSPAVQSLRTLWGDHLRLNPEPSKDDVVLVLDGDPKPWIDSGATVVLDLPLFAAAVGGTISPVTLENPNRLPIDPVRHQIHRGRGAGVRGVSLEEDAAERRDARDQSRPSG